MSYWDLLRKKGTIVTLLLLLFIHRSTSKTKRSKKDPVEIRKSLFEAPIPFAASSMEYDDDLVLLGERSADFDIARGECARGCVACDQVNGCTRCRPKTFLYVGHNPDRNRETGSCVHRCPIRFHGVRSRDGNECKRCDVPNCNSCFHSTYCLVCAEGYYLHEAACVEECPSGMGPDKWNKKCVEKVDCEVSVWSSWSPCALRSQKKSCKYGRKRRTRHIEIEPSENGKQCPKLKEAKRCKTPANKCPLVNKIYQKQIRRRNKKNRKMRRGRKNRRHEINNNDAKASRSSRNKHDKAT